jgi:D-alanyl-D-alanine carboxypeptidase/D-alanyl-D-alanine-endopeptidase (penicillin-binding protein 4)
VTTPHRRRPDPILVLVVALALPAIVLLGMRSAIGADDAVEPVPTAVVDSSVAQVVEPVLSARRLAAEFAAQSALVDLGAALAPVVSAMGDRSCLAMSVDGVPVPGLVDRAAIPASALKVLVATAAIEVLGADHRFVTTVVGPPPVDGVVDGDIVLVGGGDPLLSGDWYPTSNLDRFPVTSHTSLDSLARSLATSGVTSIRGLVLGDASRHDDERYVTEWSSDIRGVEAGPYAALLANDSRVEGDPFRGDDPVQAATEEFALRLAAAGVTSGGPGGPGPVVPGMVELARIESAPLVDVVAEMLTTSDNNTAEMLVKEIGVASSGRGTRVDGLAAVVESLRRLAVPVDDIVLVDGSGLASGNLVRCSTLVAALTVAHPAVVTGLPVLGVSGTLTGVLADHPLAGEVAAKTGTLNNFPLDRDPPAVKAFSGVWSPADGGTVRFALVLNGPTVSDQSEYRPLWTGLLDAIAAAPVGGVVSAIGPRL